MSRANVIAELKHLLKVSGLTYQALALRLGLSEAAVKRMFSKGDFSLTRLEQVCDVLGVTMDDVVATSARHTDLPRQLTPKQEQTLASDLRLLLVALLAFNHWRYEDMLMRYRLEASECLRLLVKLDRMGLIELQPGNRIKLCLDHRLRWLESGPIQQFIHQQIRQNFFDATLHGSGELELFAYGTLSAEAVHHIQNRLRSLHAEFAELHQRDSHLPLADRPSQCLLLAMRPWRLPAFDALRRNSDT